MLSHAKLSKTFWAKALMIITYVINKSPSLPLDGDVPQRVWTSKEVSSRRLKVFGCLAYVHVAKDKRRKMDQKSRPCIFLEYGDNEFGYRLWNLAEKKVIRMEARYKSKNNMNRPDSNNKPNQLKEVRMPKLH